MTVREPEDTTEPIGDEIAAVATTVHAPPALRARIAEQRLRAANPRWTAERFVPVVATLGATAAVIAGLLVVSGAEAPTVADAASAALRAPDRPAPAVDGQYVHASQDGVRFPNYRVWGDWQATGARHERLDGRPATTVLYRGARRSVGYTIVGGAPLDVPDGMRRTTVHGLRVAVDRRDGVWVVTWRAGGHTCVLASRDTPLEDLLKLATWS